MVGFIIQIAIAIVTVGWFFHLLNKCPGEIYRLKEMREDKPDIFWGECIAYLIAWAICLVLMGVLVVPFAIQMVNGWSKIGEFIQGF